LCIQESGQTSLLCNRELKTPGYHIIALYLLFYDTFIHYCSDGTKRNLRSVSSW